MKRLIAAIVCMIIMSEVALADTVKVEKPNLYQSNRTFSVSDSESVSQMDFGRPTLGQFVITGTTTGSLSLDNIQAMVVKSGTSISFSYTDIPDMVNNELPKSSWRIVNDSSKKIGDFGFKDQIKLGAIMVQKSYDNIDWITDYINTNVFAVFSPEIRNFYSARRDDLNSGCYYRVIIAYKTEIQTKEGKFPIFDPSTYERRWHVEQYSFFLIADGEAVVPSATLELSDNKSTGDVAIGVTGFANQSVTNQTAAVDTFYAPQGHGFAAEAANVRSLAKKGIFNGSSVKHVGFDNVKDGADYIVTKHAGADNTVTTYIQCKYYNTPGGTISACFRDNVFRYYSDVGVPMTVEVPADQYDKAVLLMQNRISAGQVPGVTDPEEAVNIVRKGSVTYQQAVNLAKAGTIESLVYDAETGCVTALSSFGISAVVQFAVSVWSGEPLDVALKNSIYTGLRIGGNAFVTSLLANQLTRTGLNSLLVPSSEAIIRALGPKAAAVIVNASRIGLQPIYGAAAMKSAAKMLRGGVIVNAVSLLVFTVPDIVDIFRGRISAKQLLKNFVTTAGGIAGATAGWMGGAALGTAIFPGVGTAVLGIGGTILGGIGVSLGVDALCDWIAEDDADEMLDIISNEFQNLAEEYLLNEAEATNISNQLQAMITADLLKIMFSSANHHTYARNLLLPLVENEVAKRETIVLPSENTISEGLIHTLEEIYDMGFGE